MTLRIIPLIPQFVKMRHLFDGILFYAVNETFFMGFLFMISGYFTPASYDRKGTRLFLKGRLLRLGISLVFYDLVVNPVFIYTFFRVQGELNEPIWESLVGYLKGFHIGNGPLWFIQRLLVLNVIYVLWRLLAKSPTGNPRSEGRVPGNKAIIVFAFAGRLMATLSGSSSSAWE